jgi:hypothetical protein
MSLLDIKGSRLTLSGRIRGYDPLNPESVLPSASFISGQLYDSGDVTAIDWENKNLNDAGGTLAVSWSNRQLANLSGTAIVEWNNIGLGIREGLALRFYDSDNSNYLSFNAPASVSADVTWTLPGTDGTNGQVLRTNGSGVLSWTTPATSDALVVRLATSPAFDGNIDLASAPTTIDNITAVSGNLILVHLQTAPAQNGVYVYNGAGNAMTRATSLDSAGEFLLGKEIHVTTGTYARGIFRIVVNPATLGTDPVRFAPELRMDNIQDAYSVPVGSAGSAILLPASSNSQLGNSSLRWGNIFGNSFRFDTGSGGRVGLDGTTIELQVGGSVGLTLTGSALRINPTSGSLAKPLRFGDNDDSNYIGLKAPASVTANVDLTLPDGAGSSGQYLQTNGAGILSWQTITIPSVFSDSVFRIQDNGDATKELAFEVSAIATATTRTITMPDANVNLGLIATALQKDGSVELNNNTYLTGRNAADSANINMFRVSTGNLVQVGTAFQPATTNSFDLGAVSLRWNNFYVNSGIFLTDASLSNSATTPSGNTSTTVLSSGGSRDVAVMTPNFGGSTVTGKVLIETGNQTGTAVSGNILIRTGSAAGAASGDIQLLVGDGLTEGEIKFFKVGASAPSIGNVWTATAVDGSGYWAAPASAPTVFSDSAFRVQDNGDATKQLAFEVSAITTATTRTITMPDADVDLTKVNNALLRDGTVALNNDAWFIGRNAANSANFNLFRVDSGDIFRLGRNLLPNSAAIELGSTAVANRFNLVATRQVMLGSTNGAASLEFNTTGGSQVGFIRTENSVTLPSGTSVNAQFSLNSAQMNGFGLYTVNEATATTSSLFFETGNVAGGSGNSGNLNFYTGASAGGTRGVVNISALAANLRGQTPLRFLDSDNTNFVAFRAPATVTTDVTWTLPDADGTSGQVLQTNGSGTLSWASVTAPTVFSDSVFRIQDNGDATKQLAFEVSGIATATTRTITMPNSDLNLSTGLSGSFANSTLSNLGTTAINASLLVDTSNTYNIGSSTATFARGYIQGLYRASNNSLSIDVNNRALHSFGGTQFLNWETDLRILVDLNANSNKVINLAAPTAGGDAANKTYVDNQGVWVKQTITHTALQAAALTNDISTGFVLPVRGVVDAVIIKSSTAFAGTGITAYNITLGVTGDVGKYATSYDLLSTVAGDNYAAYNMVIPAQDITATETVRIYATAVGGNLNASTAGSVDIWFRYSVLPA